jgi:RNA polymerase sigma-70 factor, ECF subfamily
LNVHDYRERRVELDDLALVERCQKGSHAAFKVLMERYQRKVYALAFGMVHNPEDAQEMVQEAFIKVHRNLDRFQGTSSFYTWLYRIAVNACIDFLRREKKSRGSTDYDDRVAHHERVNESEFPLVSSASTETPGRVQSRSELNKQIRLALAALSDKHREVILLREIEGLSYTEIAEVLDIAKGTVMSRLHHARQNLQRALEPYVTSGDAVS